MAWASGVFEIALPFKGDAFRGDYAVQNRGMKCGSCMRSRKSKQDVKAPKREINLIKEGV
jgi:hypothetical protein